METPPADEGAQIARGCAAALAIGVLTIVLVVAALSLLAGRSPDLAEEWQIFAVHMLIVAFPFGLLALAGIDGRLPWLVGLGLTLAFWSLVLLEGVRYRLSPDGSGANIGLGLIMMASPFIITVASFGAHAIEERRRRK